MFTWGVQQIKPLAAAAVGWQQQQRQQRQCRCRLSNGPKIEAHKRSDKSYLLPSSARSVIFCVIFCSEFVRYGSKHLQPQQQQQQRALCLITLLMNASMSCIYNMHNRKHMHAHWKQVSHYTCRYYVPQNSKLPVISSAYNKPNACSSQSVHLNVMHNEPALSGLSTISVTFSASC